MERKIFITFLSIVLTIFSKGIEGSCIGIVCPKGSEKNSDCKCECKPGYYRSEIFNFKTRCYRFDCPSESKKVLNETFPSRIPTCICDVRTNHWGLKPDNCNLKEGGCPSNDLVRVTGECGCSPGLQYYEGECLSELKRNTSPQGTTTVETILTKKDNSNGFKSKLGVGLGGGIGGVLLTGAVIFLCIRHRRRMKKNESNKSPAGESIPLQTSGPEDIIHQSEENSRQRNESLEGGDDLTGANSGHSQEENPKIQTEIHNHYHNGINIINCNGVQVGERNEVQSDNSH